MDEGVLSVTDAVILLDPKASFIWVNKSDEISVYTEERAVVEVDEPRLKLEPGLNLSGSTAFICICPLSV